MKKFLICLLSIFMLVSLTACGGEGESVRTAGALTRKLESKSDKKIEISKDIILTEPIEVVGNKEIVGSGTITVSVSDMEEAYVIGLTDGAQLTVGGNVEIDLSGLAGGIHVLEGTALTLQDEAIVKGASRKSSNVLVEGTFTMNGGFLKYSNGHNLINKSVTTIAGGELKGSGRDYAIVYNEGDLTQDDGTIVGGYNNVVGISGSSFTWNKGENKTSLNDAIVIEEEAKIHITSADAKLTGVYAKGLVVNGEGVIDGATMNDSMDSMVAVGQSGKLTVNGGKITEAGVNGIDNAGTMLMTNGTIFENRINGICNTGTLEITGGNILDNDSKGILNKAGTAKLLHEDVFINGNRFGIANEIGAYFEIAAATIIQSGESNVYAYGGEMYFHDVALKSSGAGCMNVATADVILENVAIQGTNGGSGAHGIYMTGGTVTAKDTTFSAVNGSAIRVKDDAVFKGTNLTIEKIENNGIFISGGTVDIDKLATSEISGCNVYADGGTLTLSDSSLGKCADWSIKAYGKDDAVMNLNNVKILGHEKPVNDTVGGINVSGGTVTAKNLTISNTVSKGIQNKGGKFTGRNVKISNTGGFGVSTIGGVTELTKFTTSGVKSCNIYMDSSAALTVTDAVLGKCTDWSIKAYGKEDSVMNLKNVEIQGHVNPVNDTVGGINVSGGTVTAENLVISDTVSKGIQNKGGKLTAKDVKISNTGSFAVSTIGGATEFTNLTTSGVRSCNIYMEGSATLAVTDAVLGKCADWSIKAYGKDDSVMNLKNVELLGHENAVNDTVGGINVSGGTVTAEKLTISDVVSKGIQNKGGKLTAEDVKISNTGGLGISAIGGVTKFTNLTTSGVKSSNIYMESNAALTVTDAVLGKCKDNSIKAYGNADAVMNLNNVKIMGQTKDALSNVHGLIIDNGTVTTENLTIQDTVASGLRIRGGAFTGKDVEISNAGENGVNANGGVAKITNLTTSDVTGSNIFMYDSPKLTLKDATLGKCTDNSIKEYGKEDAVLKLNNVTVLGHEDGVNGNLHGLIIDNGAVTAKELTIQDTVASGVRVRGGKLNAEDVTISRAGTDGLNMTAGVVKIDGMTMETVGNHGVYMAAGDANITNLTMSKVTKDGMNMAAGTAKINGLTMTTVGSNGIYMTGGTADIKTLVTSGVTACNIYVPKDAPNLTITGAELGKCGDNSIKDYGNADAVLNLNDVTVLGHTNEVLGNVHGLIIDNGTVTAKNLTIKDTFASGLRVRGGKLTAEDVTISNAGADGMNMTAGTATINGMTMTTVGNHGVYMGAGTANVTDVTMTQVTKDGVNMIGGTATINGLKMETVGSNGIYMTGGTADISAMTTSGVAACNIYVPKDAPNLTITGAELGKCKDSSIKAQGNKDSVVNLNDVTVYGHVDTDLWVHGLIMDNGTVTANNLTVKDTVASGLRVRGGNLIAEDVTISNVGSEGVNMSAGTAAIDGLKMTTVGNHGVYIGAGTASITDVTMTQVTKDGVNVIGGTLTLNGADITGTTHDVYNTTSDLKLAGVIKADVYNDAAVTINADSLAGSEMTIDWNLEKLPTTMVGIQFSSDENAAASAKAVTFGSNLANDYVPYFTNNQMLIMDKKHAFFTVSNYEELEAALTYVEDNNVTSATITLDGDIVVPSTITIKSGRNITLIDDENLRNIVRGTGFDVTKEGVLFKVEDNASLTFKGTGTDKNPLLVVNGSKGSYENISANWAIVQSLGEGSKVNVNAGVKFIDNCSGTTGGVIEMSAGTLTVNGGTFTGNNTLADGKGGVLTIETGVTATIENAAFTGNSATKGNGGAIRIADGSNVTIEGCTFNRNTASWSGGAIDNANKLKDNGTTITNCKFESNVAEIGGAISMKSGTYITLEDCTFTGNTANTKYNGIPKGNDIRIGGAATEVHLSGKMDADIFNETISTVFVDGVIEEGSDVKLEWCADDASKVPSVGVQFASADVMEASKDYIRLGEMACAKYSLVYVNATGKLVKPYVVTNFNGETESLTAALTEISNSTDKVGVIRLGADIDVSSAITIPANCNVTIEDDGSGNVHTINSKIASKDWHMITVKNDATLTFRSTGTANDYRLVLDGTSVTNKGAMIDLSGNANTVLNIYNGVKFQNINTTAAGATIRVESAGGVVNVDGAHFEAITAKEGSAFYLPGGNATCTIKNTVFKNCSSTNQGGAVEVKKSVTCTITDSMFENIHCGNNYDGGAIYIFEGSSCTITDTTFSNCQGRDGGAIYNLGTLKLVGSSEDALFTNNSASRYGGAVYTKNGTFEADGYIFDGNSAKAGGAIITWTPESIVKNTTFKNNHTNVTGGFDGGAVYAAKNSTFTDCIFEKNMAIGKGGAIFNTDKATCTLNTTEGSRTARFSENTATGGGNAIYINNGTLTGSGYVFTPEFSQSVTIKSGATNNYSN